MPLLSGLLPWLLPWLLLPPPALAAPAAPAAPAASASTLDAPQITQTYALLVGSNRPGPGQAALSYAGSDADLMAQVLQSAGGLQADHLVQLQDPDADTLTDALDAFADRLATQEEAGQRTAFFFYYSGHARAQGLDLGDQTLTLTDLRARLLGLDADLTLAVLDACQSGAVTDAKGVAPAADFSTSSVSGLSAEGFAVIASSSDTELSQESQALGGGVFTAHLATGLRGAADDDGDGAVTLDEAYQYAYDRTLITTAATAIGAQHVTLETDLRGQGALVLTHPREATARLQLPQDLDAELVIHSQPQQRVVAEIHKAPGRAFELALAPGSYSALVRQGDQAQTCAFVLSQGTTDLPTDDCEPIAVAQLAARGGTSKVADSGASSTVQVVPSQGSPAQLLETVFMEHALGTITGRDDPYLSRLVDFGFGEAGEGGDIDPVFSSGLSLGLNRNLSMVGALGVLDSEGRSREVYGSVGYTTDHEIDFRWTTWRAGVYARAQVPLAHDWIVPYVQAGGGLGWATTKYQEASAAVVRQRHVGPMLAGAAGLQFMPRFGSVRSVGLYWQSELVTAPIIDNLIGDRHDSGGLIHTLGIRGGY